LFAENMQSEVLTDIDRLISGTLLSDLIDRLAQFGAREDGGVDRQALTPEDLASRRFLVDHARSLGAGVYRDPMANLFFRWPGTDNSLAPVVMGSHSDSQPTGGKYDGAYGVCAALEVLRAISVAGVRPVRPIEVAVWTNEEGCRFAPGSMGALSFVHPERFDGYLTAVDTAGITVGQELAVHDAQFADVPLRYFASPMSAFVEAHIEQGPVMDQLGIPVGVVRGAQGTRWFELRVTGTAAHAGCTPREVRSDALRQATEMASRIYSAFDQGDEALRVTIGRIRVEPGAPNVIPERVTLTVDVRHPDVQTLDEFENMLKSFQAADVSVEKAMDMAPLDFAQDIRNVIRHAAERLGIRTMESISGAFHDSVHLAKHCPTGMIFVPSIGGISHNPREATAAEDLLAGTRVLAATVFNLAY
jgi:N-carbamoyl-L-amino-acid hydrolase